ncbi:MAG: hexitol phosphatase HxpB [Salinivirgaceae bacterium]|nr:hexitol phosphatase HxpB [Salinivirgaceae bacterium]
MIKSVIFDMDGLIVDSEPFWRMAERTVFGSRGIELSEEQCRSTTGMRLDNVVAHWDTIYPGHITDKRQTASEILAEVTRLVTTYAEPMPGVHQAAQLFAKRGCTMALASASAMSLINAVLDKLCVRQYFNVIQSAENVKYGKPHPEIFLTTAASLGAKPEECLVLEDSIFGVIAGKAASMKVIAVPDKELAGRREYGVADAVLHSLTEIDEELFNQL